MDKKLIVKILIGIAVLVLGICIGVFTKNFPVLEIERKVSLIETFTFLTTLGIAIAFPFLIEKWITDNNSIKNYLVKEVEELIVEAKTNRDIIEKSYQEEKFDVEHRDAINFTFHKLELQIASIQKQFEISFPKSKSIVDDLKISFWTYKDYLTDGEMMYSSFTKVDIEFYRKHSNEFSKFESDLKETIHKVHRI